MVSRSRQSDNIIAVICQAALRYKRQNISSWFLQEKLSESIITDWDSMIAQRNKSHFPARKSRFYLCNEVFLDARIMANTDLEQHRNDQLFIAEIKMPNPSSEGATSTFFPSHGARSAERFLWMQDWIIVADIIIAAEFILLPVIYVTTSGRRGNIDISE